jgi:hypothetical protein
VLQHNAHDGFWTIVTGLPKAERELDVIFRVDRTGGSEPTPAFAVKKPRLATLSLSKKPNNNDNGP